MQMPKMRRRVRLIALGLVMVLALAMETHAYDNNSGEMDTFPVNGDYTMNENLGTIHTVEDNASIGTNSGTIEVLRGHASLNTNGGTVKLNIATIVNNYETIDENHGTVENMRSGTIGLNGAAGIVTVNPAAAITIGENKGKIIICGGNIVKVEKNSGIIILKDQAMLTCNINSGTIERDENTQGCDLNCTNNYETIPPSCNATNQYFPIEFEGVEGTGISCASNFEGRNYTKNYADITFTLPEGCVCTNGHADLVDEALNEWKVTTYINDGEDAFVVQCHKCTASGAFSDEEHHWQECKTCHRILNWEVHTYGDYVSNGDATKTRICTCGHAETVIDEDPQPAVQPVTPKEDIVPVAKPIAIRSLVFSKGAFYCTGKNQGPVLTVKGADGKALTAGTDYIIRGTKKAARPGTYQVRYSLKKNMTKAKIVKTGAKKTVKTK